MSRHRKAFEDFAEKAQEELGDGLKQLYLYGSVARGEEAEESDVDIFAVVENQEQKQKLEDLAFETGLEHSLMFSPNIKTQESFKKRKDYPFTKTVLEEGEKYA